MRLGSRTSGRCRPLPSGVLSRAAEIRLEHELDFDRLERRGRSTAEICCSGCRYDCIAAARSSPVVVGRCQGGEPALARAPIGGVEQHRGDASNQARRHPRNRDPRARAAPGCDDVKRSESNEPKVKRQPLLLRHPLMIAPATSGCDGKAPKKANALLPRRAAHFVRNELRRRQSRAIFGLAMIAKHTQALPRSERSAASILAVERAFSA